VQPDRTLVQGELACVQGGALCGVSSFVSVVCALCLSFVLSQMCQAVALHKGFETCLLQVILLFAFVWLSIACWSFFLFVSFLFLFLLLLCVGVVNALIKVENEDHVWFEDWWMVASLCDE
jgi:hypothetical protein